MGTIFGVSVFGVAMFLWGQLSARQETDAISELSYLHGFREGWESAVGFEDEVRVIWDVR